VPELRRARGLANQATHQALGGAARARRGRLRLLRCGVRWTIYLEPTGPDAAFAPLAEPVACRPRWRYRGGWL